MANSIGIEDWLLNNAKLLKVQIERMHWGKSLLTGLHDISLKIEYEGQEFYGSGAANDESAALHKAFSETIERIVFQEQNFPTTSGMAAHISTDLAAKAAKHELLERDLFLCHFLTKSPFQKSEINLQLFPNLEAWANKTKIKFSSFRLGNFGAVCLADGRDASDPFGFIISSAYKDNFSKSNESAIISTARWAHRIYAKRFIQESITLTDFEKIPKPRLQDHGRLARDLDYANRVSYLFKESSNQVDEITPFIKINFYRPSNPIFSNCPIYVARASSIDTQDLFAGNTSIEKLNLSRLSNFAKRQLTWKDLNKIPHPLD